MKTDQQKQAENLFFQTNLSKTEIAETVGVSRRTVHYWVKQNHWDAIRDASFAMPTFLAGNCYLILARLQQSILERTDAPVTMQEVNAIYKLTTTISKLNGKGAFSENLEALTRFMEFTESCDPKLADDLQPVVAAFAGNSAAQQPTSFIPPVPRDSTEEQQLDLEDLAAWAAELKECTNQSSVPQAATPTAAKPAPAKSGTLPPPPPHLNRAARRALARKAA